MEVRPVNRNSRLCTLGLRLFALHKTILNNPNVSAVQYDLSIGLSCTTPKTTN